MRKIILSLAVSLDGFIEGPNGEYDWCFTDQDYGMSDFFKRIDTIFMGRKSYDLALTMNETVMPGIPKLREYVFSRTLKEVRSGSFLIKGDIGAEVLKIKQEQGKDIWLFGGAELTSSFLNLGLVDELSLAIHPIILGAGKPLFIDIQNRMNLHLVDTKSYSSGLVIVTYEKN